MIKIPDPADYGMSPKYGFLSPDRPLPSFKHSYYEPWDSIIPNLSKLIGSHSLRDAVDKLPSLSIDKLTNDLDYRRAYVVLAFLVHAYVWSPPRPEGQVPPQIAGPFLEVCKYLRMEPVLSYAGLCSWNWQIRNGGEMDLDHMDTIGNFTGTRGEAAFYHIPVLTEYEGGHLIHLLLDAIRASTNDDRQVVLEALNETSASIEQMGRHLTKFHGVLNAQLFYHEHRPFMAGGKGMEEKGHSRGMVFMKADRTEIARQCVGGSAAQSSLFPLLDSALGVVHNDKTVFEVSS